MFALASCTKDPAGPSGSAVSVGPQMAQLNANLPAEAVNDHYRNTYEVFLYSYYDSDGDGIGDLKGLQQKLDYIQDMGFNSLWLMPVCPSPTYHKYDVTNYMDIDPQYGTLADFDALIKDCHARGITVITDLVLNHTSVDHPWFKQAHDYLKELPADWGASADYCPYFDYYNFSRDRLNGYEPLADTNWYYEARFWSGMPDLRLDSEAVREEIRKVMEFWLDHGVDGFRLDAVTSFYTGNDAQNIEFLRWLCEAGRQLKQDCYFVAEGWTSQDTYASYYASGIDSMFDFAFADSGGVIANTLKGSFGADDYVYALAKEEQLYKSISASYVNAPFYTNHDMGRSAGYYAGDDGTKTKLAEALNLLMQGNAFTYYGEEIGMKGSGKDENKRAPMYWSEDAGAQGMCTGPADMDEVKMKYDSLQKQQEDPYSIVNYVREALRIRNAFPVIARGNTIPVDDLCEEETAVMCREDGEHTPVCIALNLDEAEHTIDLNQCGYTVLSAVLNTSDAYAEVKDGILKLPAYTIAVLTK
ncbi:MAG: hypothetical protein IKS37_03360 [Solobacterium sp.]|nr:hypothetical protein [Solobacterium sp.]